MLLSALVLGGCASPSLMYQDTVEINARLRLGMEKYQALPLPKMFAGATDGAYIFVYRTSETKRAIRLALSLCQHKSSRPCRVLDLNGEPYQDAYLKYAARSHQALLNLRIPPLASCHSEMADWHVNPPAKLRSRPEGYAAPAPIALTGVKTLTTTELSERLRRENITLIDTSGWDDDEPDQAMQTIPNACFVDWAGTEDGEEKEAALLLNFSRLMHLMEPDKTQPVCAFCESSECWLSVNGALRLQALGYTNVY